MINILDYYQDVPLHINPTAFTVGSFSIGWYSLMYIVACSVIYLLLAYRLSKKEGSYDKNFILDFLMYALLGVLIGGRLGYVLIYNPAYYFHNPVAIISPYDFSTGELTGIYGMSYHGGLLAILAITLIFTKKNKINFWQFADFVVPAIPAGYFFGRIGNFLNLELYGRVTDSWIGMHFPLELGGGPFLRYPSQLFEALLEGAVLFCLLWFIRNRSSFSGYFVSIYLMGYGVARIIAEFFREPDQQIGFIGHYFTLGQILSFCMVVFGVWIYLNKKNKLNQIKPKI